MINTLHFCSVNNYRNMKLKFLNVAIIAIALQLLISCNNSIRKGNVKTEGTSSSVSYTKRHVMTKGEQDSLTPATVLTELMAGNERFQHSNNTERDHSATIRNASNAGQFPKAIVLSCIDSRVPVEDIFDQGIGDLFVARVAGNIANTDMLGSMEYACKVAGAKLIVVIGHEHCGAVKGAVDNVQLGNITDLLKNIKPAILKSEQFEGAHTAKNEDYLEVVNKNNVLNTISEIRTRSEILRDLENKGAIKIVGAYYSLLTGKLTFLN